MNEDIKEKLDLNPNNMNEIAKEAYYQLENYITNLEKQNTELKERYGIRTKAYNNILLENANLKDNWNKLKEWLEDENNQQYSKYIYNYSINNWVLNKMQEIEGGMND